MTAPSPLLRWHALTPAQQAQVQREYRGGNHEAYEYEVDKRGRVVDRYMVKVPIQYGYNN